MFGGASAAEVASPELITSIAKMLRSLLGAHFPPGAMLMRYLFMSCPPGYDDDVSAEKSQSILFDAIHVRLLPPAPCPGTRKNSCENIHFRSSFVHFISCALPLFLPLRLLLAPGNAHDTSVGHSHAKSGAKVAQTAFAFGTFAFRLAALARVTKP